MAKLQRIKEIAEQKKITLDNLAEQVGISVQAIHLMVRKNSTKIETIERIAKALNVSVLEFFTDDIRNVANAQGAGSAATNSGNINIVNEGVQASQPSDTAERKPQDDDVRVLRERIRGLEAQLKLKDEMIELLKQRMA